MSIRPIPAQFRLYCDSGQSPDCMRFSKYLFMNYLEAERLAGKKGGDWLPSPHNPTEHLCWSCHEWLISKGAKVASGD